MKLTLWILPFLLSFHVLAARPLMTDGPVVIGNGAGGEENQYVTLWYNRDEIFGRCQQSLALCSMSQDELVALQKMANAAHQWQPFRFFPDSEFSIQKRNLAVVEKVPFVAFSQSQLPGLVIFNQTRMYDDGNKFSYDLKLTLLSLIAAQQSGLNAAQADSVVKKLVAFWQERWLKLDLRIVAQPNLQIWVQSGEVPALLLFDDQGVSNLMVPLKQQLQCPAGTLLGLHVTSPFWSSYNKSNDVLKATFAGVVTMVCSGGSQPSPLNFEMELVFQLSKMGWVFQKPLLKVHISSLN